MPSHQHLQSFIRYKAWANHRIFHWLSKLSNEELVSKRETVFRNIFGTMNHTYAMDAVWQAHLEGKSHEFTTDNPATSPTLAELRDAQKRIDDWYIEYTDNLQPEAIDHE